jgi:dihydroneopterin aldolase
MSRDRILLQGLRVHGRHGVLPHEAELGQVFVVDLELHLDLAPAGRSGDLGDTVDYGELAGRVAELVGGRPRRLLESVAEDLAALALADPRVEAVRVRVAKPHAPLPVDASVAVEVTRTAPGGVRGAAFGPGESGSARGGVRGGALGPPGESGAASGGVRGGAFGPPGESGSEA